MLTPRRDSRNRRAHTSCTLDPSAFSSPSSRSRCCYPSLFLSHKLAPERTKPAKLSAHVLALLRLNAYCRSLPRAPARRRNGSRDRRNGFLPAWCCRSAILLLHAKCSATRRFGRDSPVRTTRTLSLLSPHSYLPMVFVQLLAFSTLAVASLLVRAKCESDNDQGKQAEKQTRQHPLLTYGIFQVGFQPPRV